MSVLLRQPHGFEGLRRGPRSTRWRRSCPCAPCRRASSPCSASGPLARAAPDHLTTTRSPASMKSLIGSTRRRPRSRASCSNWRMTASRPTNGPGSGQPSGSPHDDVGVVQLTNGVHVARVPRLEARPARSPRSPATSPAQYPAGDRAIRQASRQGRSRSQTGTWDS